MGTRLMAILLCRDCFPASRIYFFDLSFAAGRLGDGTSTAKLTPTQVSKLSGVRGISAGDYHTCALMINGTAYCWGNNANGELLTPDVSTN